ncbi:hypothetical protein [Streptomyces acidicola]|uniref:hypothetical protein n=1 Tax=Streptomyces acidicola TaxID=2596892 RepID=UPI00343DB171
MEFEPGDVFACELVINGHVHANAPIDLAERLYDAGVARVVPIHTARPEPGRRSADLVAVATLAVTAAGTLVGVVDTVRRWLAEERDRRATGGPDDEGATSISLTVDGDNVMITNPSTATEERLVELFVRRHNQP